MRIKRLYQNTAIPASKLGVIRDYINSPNSTSLGNQWGHKSWGYSLQYGTDEHIDCRSFDEVAAAVGKRGETTKHSTYFESTTGRLLRIDTHA